MSQRRQPPQHPQERLHPIDEDKDHDKETKAPAATASHQLQHHARVLGIGNKTDSSITNAGDSVEDVRICKELETCPWASNSCPIHEGLPLSNSPTPLPGIPAADHSSLHIAASEETADPIHVGQVLLHAS
jgi:hypothetical protein